jgi:hypothetical protein
MTVMNKYGRPFVYFDASNKKHRQYLAEFLKTGKWGNCPVRFMVEDEGCTDLVSLMLRKTVIYYTDKEFK